MEKFTKILNKYKKAFQENEELIIREFSGLNKNMAIIYLSTFCDTKIIASEVIKPIMEQDISFIKGREIDFIETKIIINSSATKIKTFKKAQESISEGCAILIIKNEEEMLEIPLKKVERRAIAEPPTNNVIHGPRQGFIEDLATNLSLLRARIASPKLKIKKFKVGSVTKTDVAVVSISGIADDDIVKQIYTRIKAIIVDGIIDSSYIQMFLNEHPESIFKQVGTSEKPDIVAAKMLEGRIAIVVDGSPIVLTLPFILIEDLQSAEDYYDEKWKATFVRMLRGFGVVLATILPGLYIAFLLYHYKALPLKLLTTIVNAGQSIPISPAMEVLFTFLLFEILYEASVRIPKGLGSSFNIIGALILGDTAVKSNLASAPTVMVIALSSIAIYLLPDETSVLRIVRIALTLTAAIMGVVGIIIAMIFIVIYLCDFDSFGAAYLGPYAPRIKSDLKDGIFKEGLLQMREMPKSIQTKKKIRRIGIRNEE